MAGEQTRFRTGNEAAKKYSVEDARDIFQRILDEIEGDESIMYLNTVVNRLGYYAQLTIYLMRIYGEDEELVELSDRISSLLEERIVMASLGRKVDTATAIFVMKSRFGMREVQHVHTTSGDDPEPAGRSEMQKALDKASPAQLEKLLAVIQEIERDGASQAKLAE